MTQFMRQDDIYSTQLKKLNDMLYLADSFRAKGITKDSDSHGSI